MFRRRYPSSSFTNPKTCFISIQAQPKQEFINPSIKQLVQTGQFYEALKLYIKLCNNGFKPDNFTFPYILKASSQLTDPTLGFLIHNQTIKTGFDSNIFVANSLILFYGKLGHLESVRYMFDKIPHRNVVTWTATISAFSQNNRFNISIEFFRYMRILGIKPNSFTLATLLPSFSYFDQSNQIHSFLIKHGFESDIFVSTALIDVYAKCGNTLSAKHVFDEMPERNLVSWNAICLGYNQNGNMRESLKLFTEMQKFDNFWPDSFSVVTALCSCSNLASLREGKEIHGYVYKANLENSVLVGNGLIDMYGKCGFLELADHVFDKMQERDVGSWTALIMCHGLHGQGVKAIEIFEKMKKTKAVTPNSVTLVAILTACSHSCLVEDGFKYFKSLNDDFGIEPAMKHYICMVDLLGRAGLLAEALKFINEMPVQADSRVWEALLGSATIQGDMVVAEIAAKNLMESESENPELCVQLANIYANSGKWDDVVKIRGSLQSMKLRKSPGVSSVQVVL
ncbi:Pentatricopeptide repeat [Macleaya cordata]|uniref:Pentatricopeptide repeat n=1 Tax=Macleaya cordata TaxID=56857 RepID=A0A200Q0U5_MACCD|nr:Pentatricopeptide repeat [Macleaya cordata]